MKTIIAGSRTVTEFRSVVKAIEASGFDITEVVSGTARGVDQLGEQYARAMGKLIKRFPAEWDKYGKSAGYKRNEVMAEYADALIAVWDGKSRGTSHMIDLARKQGLQVYVHIVRE